MNDQPVLKQFAYWQPPCEEAGEDGAWWYYDSIQELLNQHGERSKVYRVKYEYIGRYKKRTGVRRLKAGRRKK